MSLSQVIMANTISEEILDKIISHEDYCVKGYDQEKIYLHSDNLYPTPNGVFLNLDGHEYIQLPSLQSDNGGCWVYSEKIKIFNDCPFCGEEYFITCKNPNCPSNKRINKL